MNISLTRELEKLVAKKVATGMYNSASEVIREALRLLEKKEQAEREWKQQMRAKVAEGLAEADAGHVIAYDKKSLRRRIGEVKANGRKLRGKGK